jgi:hypothetical protein
LTAVKPVFWCYLTCLSSYYQPVGRVLYESLLLFYLSCYLATSNELFKLLFELLFDLLLFKQRLFAKVLVDSIESSAKTRYWQKRFLPVAGGGGGGGI